MSKYELTNPKPKTGLEVMMYLFNTATQEVFQIVEVSSGGYVTIEDVEIYGRYLYLSRNQLKDYQITGIA